MQKNTLIGSVQLTKLNQLVTLKTATARGCLFYFLLFFHSIKIPEKFSFLLILIMIECLGSLFRKRILQIGENINEKNRNQWESSIKRRSNH